MFLRMVARPLMAKVKETTGIVGVDVVPNAREVLIGLYSKRLQELKKLPDTNFRKAVERSTTDSLKVFQEEEDWESIENRIGYCCEAEELIKGAQRELELISIALEVDMHLEGLGVKTEAINTPTKTRVEGGSFSGS